MSVSAQPNNRYIDRPAPSSLADVIEVILDKGLVIDAYVRVSLVGIELLTIDARIVVASVDTYLRFAEAASRLDLGETQVSGIPELLEGVSKAGSKGKTSGVIEAAKEHLRDIIPGSGGDEDEDAGGRSQPRPAARKTTSRSRGTTQRRASTNRG